MATRRSRSGDVPAETASLIGRRRELGRIRTALTTSRLVTLVGPGGVGKTRLAVRIASELGPRLRDGAPLVGLGGTSGSVGVVSHVLAMLGLHDQTGSDLTAMLRAHLREREPLLVLDECEPVRSAVAALVADLLAAAPGLRVLATSREPLHVAGERVIRIDGLEPPHADATPAELARNEAVSLFLERAEAASGSATTADPGELATIGAICRRLDGLPLALELAAARTRVLAPAQILDRLDDRFALLARPARGGPDRHRTLWHAIDQSHELLDADERRLFRRLAVFAGRCTLEDIEAIDDGTSPPGAILDHLTALVDQSLVRSRTHDEIATYQLHESVRAYARERLLEAGEEATITTRAAASYATQCRRSWVEAQGDLPHWLAWMDLEIDNVRALLEWSLAEGERRHAVEIAGALSWYWSTRAVSEGIQWVGRALATGAGAPEALAAAQFTRGFLAVVTGDAVSAGTAMTAAIDAAERVDDRSIVALAMTALTLVAAMGGDLEGARHRLDAASAAAAALDDVAVDLGLLHASALVALLGGDLDGVRSASAEGLRLSTEHGYLYLEELMRMNLGFAGLASGDVDGAGQHLTAALRIAERLGDRVGQSNAVAALGCRAAFAGDGSRAARLLGGSQTMKIEAGAGTMAMFGTIVDRAEALAATGIGRAAFDREYAAGVAAGWAATIRLATGDDDARTTPVAVTTAGAGTGTLDQGPLSDREQEVARLIAEGLTNKEVGARLFISERTVDTHVRHILDKLGMDSRTRIVAWVVGAWASET